MNEVAVTENEGALGRIVITENQVALIKKTVAIGATDDELKLFFYECRRRGVHPLDRLIHFVKRGKDSDARATFQSGIDFLRSQAEETGEYRGQEDIEYGPMLPIKDKPESNAPEWAKATVRRYAPDTGETYTIMATVYWDEFYPGEKLGFMWRKIPRVMLGKCAEAQALRKAFPKKLAGLYSFEEMEQADIIEHTGKPPVQQPQSKSAKQEEPLPETMGGAPVVDDGTALVHIAAIERVSEKHGKGKKGDWTLYGVFDGTNWYNTFDTNLGAAAKVAQGDGLQYAITYKVKDKGNELLNIELCEVDAPTEELIPEPF